MKTNPVDQWMSKEIITAEKNIRLHDAQRLMRASQIRVLPVLENEDLIGIVTHLDLCRADVSKIQKEEWVDYRIISKKTIGDIMTKSIVSIRTDESLPKAARIMLENQISSLPVTSNGHLTGILTTTDVLAYLCEEVRKCQLNINVRQYMTRDVVTAEKSTSLLDAHKIMAVKRLRSLPILENGKVVGIVTKTDLFSADPSVFTASNNQKHSKRLQSAPIGYIMTSTPITIQANDNIDLAAQKMIENKIHSLPVLDENNTLVGIITDTDLFKLIINRFL